MLKRRTFLTGALGGSLALASRPLAADELYEEALFDSSPYRVAQWREMAAWVDSLPAKELSKTFVWTGRPPEPPDNLRLLLGFPPPQLEILEEPVIEPIGEDSYATYYRVWVPVHRLMSAYGLLLIPRSAKRRAPMVVSLHGNVGYPELALFRGGANYHDMVRGAMLQRYVTFAPLLITAPANDDRQGTPIPRNVRQRLDFAAREKGTTLWAIEIRKIQLALGALARHPAVDPARIGIVGLSLGGYYALRTMLLDPRIRVGVVSCPPDVYVYRERAATGQYPETRDLSNAVCALGVSGRPVQLQYGLEDPLAKIDAARRTRAEIRELANQSQFDAKNIDYQEFQGRHEFNGGLAWDFLNRSL